MKVKDCFLPIITLIAGIIVLIIGMNLHNELLENTRNYKKIEAKLISYEEVEEEPNKVMYKLIFEYEVNDQKYEVKSDTSLGIVPKNGTTREVLYNENSPSDAHIKGLDAGLLFILIGSIFILGSLSAILSVILKVKENIDNKKIKLIHVKIHSLIVGAMFFGMGYGLLHALMGKTNVISICIMSFTYTTSFADNATLVILSLFMILGIGIIVSSPFITNKRLETSKEQMVNIYKTVDKIETYAEKHNFEERVNQIKMFKNIIMLLIMLLVILYMIFTRI